MGSASKLKVAEFNANSIGKQDKRSKVLHFLKKKSPDILFITDTRIAPEIENIFRNEWAGKCFFSSFSSQARGIACLIRKELAFTLLDMEKDNEGNFLSLFIEFENRKIHIGALVNADAEVVEGLGELGAKLRSGVSLGGGGQADKVPEGEQGLEHVLGGGVAELGEPGVGGGLVHTENPVTPLIGKHIE